MSNILTHRATGVAAVAELLDPKRAFQLIEVKLHLSAAGGAGDLTIAVDSLAGAAYDTLFLKQDMSTVADLLWQPTMPIFFDKGDKINIAWANANGRTYGLEVKFAPL